MPRTKVTRKVDNCENSKPDRSKLNLKLAKSYFTTLESEVKKRYIEAEPVLFKVRHGINEIALKIPTGGNKTLQELKLEAEKPPSDTISSVGSTTRSIIKNSTFLSSTKKGNNSHLPRRRSKSQVNVPRQKLARISRSVSRYRAPNDHYTPANKQCLLTFGMVTPKIKPNTPQVVLRRPKQGEMAISMQGSPLMVSSVINDHIANINIPLQDGRIISIQPNRGLRPSELPVLDPETRRQIEALRDNLNTVCALPTNR